MTLEESLIKPQRPQTHIALVGTLGSAIIMAGLLKLFYAPAQELGFL